VQNWIFSASRHCDKASFKITVFIILLEKSKIKYKKFKKISPKTLRYMECGGLSFLD
jgi:hypothetical protein